MCTSPLYNQPTLRIPGGLVPGPPSQIPKCMDVQVPYIIWCSIVGPPIQGYPVSISVIYWYNLRIWNPPIQRADRVAFPPYLQVQHT